MYIELFLGHYSDEQLAAALAHCEDGKFSFYSCCCLIGIPTANHPLKSKMRSFRFFGIRFGAWNFMSHYRKASNLMYAYEAERELRWLADSGIEPRILLIPIFRAEMERRDKLRSIHKDWAQAHINAVFSAKKG